MGYFLQTIRYIRIHYYHYLILLFAGQVVPDMGSRMGGSRGGMQQQQQHLSSAGHFLVTAVSHGAVAEPDLACDVLFSGQSCSGALEFFLEASPTRLFLVKPSPYPPLE